jgi:hypothetical protein
MRKIKLLLPAAILAVSMALTACGSTKGTESENTVDTSKLVYGTATLSYSEFYAGDVSSVDSFDAVSSATYAKYSIMENMYTDFVDETKNANGYNILGVANVAVAVNEKDVDAYKAINSTFEVTSETPAQYKVATVKDGKADYSATVFNIADTVKDATAELQTGTTWGDYQINVTDGAKKYLRNSREDEGFAINSQIQGIILETSSGLKVGMEYLQSIWVQPYEVSFNVPSNNTHNTHIVGYDNLNELAKLVGENVTKITYIMPTETYVYEFDGIYIKPSYSGEFSATVDGDALTITPDSFTSLKNPQITVTYTVGSGKTASKYTLYSGAAEGASYKLNTAEIASLTDGTYSVVISSDNYADITVALPTTESNTKSGKGEK